MNRIIKIFNYQFYVKKILLLFFTYLLIDKIRYVLPLVFWGMWACTYIIWKEVR